MKDKCKCGKSLGKKDIDGGRCTSCLTMVLPKAKAITKDAKKKYLKSPFHCPYCGNKNISSDSIDSDEGGAVSMVSCYDCKKEWRDVYKVVDVEEV